MHGHSLGRVRSPEPRRRKSCRASCFERSCDLQEGSRSARSTLMERQPGNKSPGLTHPTLWPPGGAPLPNPIRSQRGRSTWSKDTKAILPSTECGSGGLMGTYLAYPTSSSVKWAVVRVKWDSVTGWPDSVPVCFYYIQGRKPLGKSLLQEGALCFCFASPGRRGVKGAADVASWSIFWFQNLLQSSSNQDGMVLAEGQTARWNRLRIQK